MPRCQPAVPRPAVEAFQIDHKISAVAGYQRPVDDSFDIGESRIR